MAKREPKRASRGGLIALVVVAAVLGLGFWLGQRQEASLSPCERYAKAVRRALDNCHSGANRDFEHHVALCERGGRVTDACLDEIDRLSRVACDDLERRAAANQLCRE